MMASSQPLGTIQDMPRGTRVTALKDLDFVGTYETVVLAYLVTLLFLHPYGIALNAEANLRFPDLVALVALMAGFGGILLRGKVYVNHLFYVICGAFVVLELVLPVLGAVGYKRPVDLVSAFRMAMFWMPMVFLTMLAPAHRALRFEQRLDSLLLVTLWLNLGYALVQIGVSLGFVPRSLVITNLLSPWALDQNVNIIQGLRPAGFFANSTALSAFAVVCLCFFYAKYVAWRAMRDLVCSLMAVALVVFTASRAAFVAAIVILLVGWLRLPVPRKMTVLSIVVAGSAALLWTIEATIGIAETFYRFQRLLESGLLEDQSFAARFYHIWPAAIDAARDYTVGTLIQAPRALPLIDSGYLNYYLQGKWVFVVALAAMLAGLWFVGIRAFVGGRGQRIGVMSLFLAIYLTGGLIISNPLRSPLVVFFIVFALWRVRSEQSAISIVPPAVAQGRVPGTGDA